MDAGTGAHGDRQDLPRLVLGGGGAEAAAPPRLVLADSGAPGDRTRRGHGGAVEEGSVAAGGTTAAALGAWIVFEDEAGFAMTPPHARTWGPRGHTPVVRVRGRSWRRMSVAALACYKPGEQTRLIYRPRFHLRLKGARNSFAWTDYRDLLVRAHIQLGGPIVVVWDNLNTHRTVGLRKYAADHKWLTVFQLPSYAPDLNPVEGVWSLLRRSYTANVAFKDPEHLAQTVRHGLAVIQRHPHLIDGCLKETGLTITAPVPTSPRKGQ